MKWMADEDEALHTRQRVRKLKAVANRIETALRRRPDRRKRDEPEPYRSGELVIDYRARRVSVSGRPVQLTATEFALLAELSANAGRVLTHDQLLQQVWGTEYSGEGQLVRVFVGNLRRKLGDDARDPTYIFTMQGVGYHMPKP